MGKRYHALKYFGRRDASTTAWSKIIINTNKRLVLGACTFTCNVFDGYCKMSAVLSDFETLLFKYKTHRNYNKCGIKYL